MQLHILPEFSGSIVNVVNFEDPQEVVKEVKSSEPEFNRNLLKRWKSWNFL